MKALVKFKNKGERCHGCEFVVAGRCSAKWQITEIFGDCDRGFKYIYRLMEIELEELNGK